MTGTTLAVILGASSSVEYDEEESDEDEVEAALLLRFLFLFLCVGGFGGILGALRLPDTGRWPEFCGLVTRPNVENRNKNTSFTHLAFVLSTLTVFVVY